VATELTMPQMGYDMQEGTVVRWLKEEGSEVKNGEAIAEIETDKAVVEFESYASGILSKVLVSEGTIVPVGEIIAIVTKPGEILDDIVESSSETENAIVEDTVEVDVGDSNVITSPVAKSTGSVSNLPIKASPVARRIADERGIDLGQISGTGPGSRITKADVLNFEPAENSQEDTTEDTVVREVEIAAEETVTHDIEAPTVEPEKAPSPMPESGSTEKPLSRMRQQIARVTSASKQEKPHFYVTCDIDMTDAMTLRKQINDDLSDEGVRVTVNDLIIKACVQALKRFPKVNAELKGDVLKMNDAVNVGVAMTADEGLLMPAIMNCEGKSLREISVSSRDLGERAKNGTLRPEEYTGGTFGVSNLGMFDVTTFIAIIQPPQSAILAVGTVSKKPVVRDDELVIRQMMSATISADHRVIDGVEGAQFVIEVKRILESPMLMLV